MSGAGLSGTGSSVASAAAQGARRTADALVGRLAADSIVLRTPAPPTAAADAEQLGWAQPEFRDIPVTPALLRVQAGRTLAMVSATALEQALGVDGEQAVLDVLAAASFVQAGDRLFTIEATERRAVAGRAYLYRLLLRDPATNQTAASARRGAA